MTKNNTEITSTEKLLKVIRSSSDENVYQSKDFTRPGFLSKLRGKWHFSRSSRDRIGIEIFRDTINLVRTSKTKTVREVTCAMSEPMPAGMDIHHPDFPDLLKELIEKCGGGECHKADIWACLPASKGEMWSVQVPKIRKGLSNAVYWSARKEKSFNEAENIFDYRITAEIKVDGIPKLIADVCIVPTADVNLYKKVFADAGFPLKGITLPAFAMENLFARELVNPGKETYAVLYIGEESSWINIHTRDRILFSRVIRTGRDSILDSLIQEYHQQSRDDNELVLTVEPESGEITDDGTADKKHADDDPLGDKEALSPEQAATLLKRFEDKSSEPPGDFHFEQVFAMIEPVLERLARQLERTFDHSVNVLNNPAPSRIYICGGLSVLPRIIEFFSRQLGIRANLLDVWNPSFSHVSPDLFISEPEHRFSLVSAAGLAMQGSRTINFFYTASDRAMEKETLRRTNAVAAGCALLFVLTSGYWWYSVHQLKQPRMEVEMLEHRLDTFSPRINMEMITRMAGKYQQEQQSIRDYSRNLQVVAIISEINRITPENIQMLGITMSMGRPGEDTARRQTHVLTLEGFIRHGSWDSDTYLAVYVHQLRRSPMIRDVTIRRTEKDFIIAGESVYRFIVNIDLEKV